MQEVPDIDRRVRVGRYAGTFRPDPDAVVLGSTGDPDGRYRTVAVSVPQGTLITSISLNPTNDTLASLRRVELTASLAVLLAMGLLVLLVVRRGSAAPAPDGGHGRCHRLGGPDPPCPRGQTPPPRWAAWVRP